MRPKLYTAFVNFLFKRHQLIKWLNELGRETSDTVDRSHAINFIT
ncbi:MAG TPA: hypothetical protein VHN59_05510 [Chitinophagaceae bacterium]|nr:hypothetical protein [Chitinophagaceae bacterium]